MYNRTRRPLRGFSPTFDTFERKLTLDATIPTPTTTVADVLPSDDNLLQQGPQPDDSINIIELAQGPVSTGPLPTMQSTPFGGALSNPGIEPTTNYPDQLITDPLNLNPTTTSTTITTGSNTQIVTIPTSSTDPVSSMVGDLINGNIVATPVVPVPQAPVNPDVVANPTSVLPLTSDPTSTPTTSLTQGVWQLVQGIWEYFNSPTDTTPTMTATIPGPTNDDWATSDSEAPSLPLPFLPSDNIVTNPIPVVTQP